MPSAWFRVVLISGLFVLTNCSGNVFSESGASSVSGTAVAVPAHLLNRTEYNATVRDLLPTTSTPADAFPIDNVSVNGLDNMAAALTISPSLFADYEQAARALASEIVDPLDTNAAVPTYAPAHKNVTCNPNTSDPNACARSIYVAFAQRAWRRPVAPNDANNLTILWQAQTGSWDANLKTVLAAILLSPRFLFRLEQNPTGATGAVALDSYQMASRLSYFLWSSMPDDALFAAAANNALMTTDGIMEQVDRMLADPKASALGSNFAAQWLNARYLPQATPDPNVFPAFNANITRDMVQETQTFFNAFIANGQPVQNMFTATYTYANDELATYYGLTPAGSSTAVQVAAPQRNGILSLGAWLTVQSMANRTSPTKRGEWILGQLMCTTPPAVPAGVSATLPVNSDPNLTIRQQMSAHDTDPTCAACHALMDPMGNGLGTFNGVAQLQSKEAGQPIDTTGKLPDGTAFANAAQLAQLLSQDPRFPACLESLLFAYATGYMPANSDQTMMTGLQTQWAQNNYTLRALIETIATSSAFRTRWVAP